MDIGTTIKNIRHYKGVSHRELSRSVGVSPGYLSEIETGKKEPSKETMAKIAKGLGVPLEVILFISLNETQTRDKTIKKIQVTMKALLESFYPELVNLSLRKGSNE